MKIRKPELKEEKFKLAGVEYTFNVKEPNTEDKLKYMARSVRKNNGKIDSSTETQFQAKFNSGSDLIIGFPENFPDGTPQFELDDGTPISSDVNSKYYREDWKELILNNFVSQILVFATREFEGFDISKTLEKAEEQLKEIETELEDDESPLESSSFQH